MNLFKCSYKSLSRYCNSKRKKEIKKRFPNSKHFLKEPAMKIGSSNPMINGVWKAKKLIKYKDQVKGFLFINNNYLENRQLLKAYSTLVFPRKIKGYKEKRESDASKLKEDTMCQVCKKHKAYCNHHIILLIHGGSNSESNLIPICKECHKSIHDWL